MPNEKQTGGTLAFSMNYVVFIAKKELRYMEVIDGPTSCQRELFSP